MLFQSVVHQFSICTRFVVACVDFIMRPRTRIPQRVVMYIYINSLLYIYYNIIHNVPGVFRKTNIVFQDTGSETTANREILEQLETEAVFFKVDRRVQRLPGRSSCNIKSNR